MDAKEKLIRARTALLLDHPFFGTLALRLKLVEDNNMQMKTLAVNGKTIFYDKQFIESLEPHLLRSALAHEVMHCVYSHITRRGARDPKKWNRACDYVVNEQLVQAGMSIGDGWLHEPAFYGMSADHIYNLLPESDGGGDGLCDIQQDTQGTPEMSEQDWRVATSQAAQAAAQAGKLPDTLKRFVDEMARTQVDWREVLRRFIDQAVNANDYSWLRPNRRMLPAFYMPSLYSHKMGRIAVAIDTSGSIDQQTLNVFGAEITAIHQDCMPEKTHVIYCDAQVNGTAEFEPDDTPTFELMGGGGTDFRPVFEHVSAEMEEPPVCLIYLTDMYGSFPEQEPEYPVLWIATSEAEGPFGETVKIQA